MLETEFRWDGRDAYGRTVFGAATVKIVAGYEYADCPETVVIEKTTVVDASVPKDDKVLLEFPCGSQQNLGLSSIAILSLFARRGVCFLGQFLT